ncbi:hypothetical protein PS708_00594 [Pseudomonas fluorescens]|nr:hypothetical protein PS708_00594 [Pseudomonas fluorescens]
MQGHLKIAAGTPSSASVSWYTLRKDGWVIISDGKSTEALPITFCGPAIIEAFNAGFA